MKTKGEVFSKVSILCSRIKMANKLSQLKLCLVSRGHPTSMTPGNSVSGRCRLEQSLSTLVIRRLFILAIVSANFLRGYLKDKITWCGKQARGLAHPGLAYPCKWEALFSFLSKIRIPFSCH